MAKEYTVAWVYYYFYIKYLPSIWRANTNFSTYNTTMSSCRHTSFTHVQISLTHLLPAIYMTQKINSVEATVILDGAPAILLRKSQNSKCSTCGHFSRGDEFCDCLIFSFRGIWTGFAPHQWIVTWERRDMGKTTLVTTIWERRWPQSNYLLTHRDSYLV